MKSSGNVSVTLDLDRLRTAIREEYELVACQPERGFHFHTGKPLARLLGYSDEWLAGIPETAIKSFAGTGNPIRMGTPQPGEMVVDVGSGAGLDSLISAKMVAPDGRVVGVDMTPAMIEKAQLAAQEAGSGNVEYRQGQAESLPVEAGWADVVISNGVLNLVPDKLAALKEMARVLKPGGRLQIGDILVQKAVSESAKNRIDLWTG
ncbi:MAG: methyltransferase domain-containing protein [Chloroflexota bacterium]|nr:MAG: methyltransferase domain-containing protein [Chloroflexota bacterium]